MDQLDEWAVRGRVATAARRVREDLVRLAVDGEELADAMTEARQLGFDNVTAAEVRNGWALQPVSDSVEWLLPPQHLVFTSGPETAR